MTGWTTIDGKMACLNIDNIDTDQLIPARFMSQPRADGYAEFLLHDLRRDKAGELKPEFILNKYSDVSTLLVGKNFGSGSSREAAVYALVDNGIRVVIATSFGDIFAANAVNNGLLPAQVNPTQHQELLIQAANTPIPCTVDLQTSTIRLGNQQIPFEIDETWRLKLINGWDDADLTLGYRIEIDQYRHKRYQEAVWAWPTNTNG